MKYKGVLFDLDGVILPSDKLHYLAWKKVCFHEHIFLYDLMFEETLGISKKEALKKILEHAKITLDERNQKWLIAEKDFYYEQYLKNIDENFVSVKVIRVLNKLQNAVKKAPVKTVVLLERVMKIITSYPLEHIRLNNFEAQTISKERYVKELMPEIIISESFNL